MGATLHAGAIPTAPGYAGTCEALDIDPVALALTGGEDYELLFTAAGSPKAAALGTKIGVITEGSVVRVRRRSRSKRSHSIRPGFRHFS